MEKLSREFFVFDDSTLAKVLSHLVHELGTVDAKPERPIRRVYFDTFDWRLHLAGYSLAVEFKPAPGRSELRRLGSGRLIFREPRAVARFAWENPPGPLRDFLTEHIGIRALLPLVELRGLLQGYSVRDKRGKVVLGVVRETARAVSFIGEVELEMKPRLRLEGVRGHKDALQKALAVARNCRMQKPVVDILGEALAAVGLRVEKYQPKPTLPLDPNMSAIAAMTTILLYLRRIMEINLRGTTLNLDPEFLHDFRVAVRRTRSALGQTKEVFPEASLRPFREEFKWLGSITGSTRDLDVYLLKFPGFCRNLPEAIRPDLEPLREFLQRHQQQAQKILAGELQSSRLRNLLDAWSEYLESSPDATGLPPTASIPIGELASAKIRKTYRKFIREGGKIKDHSQAEAFHRLRITGKQLRYLLEFFQALFPPRLISVLVKEMKLVQNFLGEFQDLTFQQKSLREFAEEMKREKDIPAATLLAMELLMEDMKRRQQAMRLEFRDLFEGFSGGKGGRLFRKLFACPGKKAG